MRKRGWASALLLIALGLTGSGCLQLGKIKGAVGARSAASLGAGGGKDYFTQQVHPYFRRNCASCHGVSQNPMFAVPNVDEAYKTSSPIGLVADATQSDFYRKVKDGHCGSNCATDGSALLKLIQGWIAAEKNSASGAVKIGVPPPVNTILTASQALPSDVATATGNTFRTMTFQMSTNTPAPVGLPTNISFRIEVQQFSPRSQAGPGAYRFRNPRLVTPSTAVHVRGIRVVVNGKYDPAFSEFPDIDTVVAAGSTATSTAISTALLLIVQDKDAGDMIQIGFDVLEPGVAVTGCKNLANFATLVSPGMHNQCMNCHGTIGNPAYAAMRLVQDNGLTMATPQDTAGNCVRALQRVNVNTPAQSRLVLNPTGQNGHSTVGGFTSAMSLQWQQWINSER